MNRRQFLSTIGLITGAAVLGKLVTNVADKPIEKNLATPTTIKGYRSIDHLLTDAELSPYFKVVGSPNFVADNGHAYATVTRKLAMRIDNSLSHPYSDEVKAEAINQIQKLGFTHVFAVVVGGYIYEACPNLSQPYDPKGRLIMVRGCHVHKATWTT